MSRFYSDLYSLITLLRFTPNSSCFGYTYNHYFIYLFPHLLNYIFAYFACLLLYNFTLSYHFLSSVYPSLGTTHLSLNRTHCYPSLRVQIIRETNLFYPKCIFVDSCVATENNTILVVGHNCLLVDRSTQLTVSFSSLLFYPPFFPLHFSHL